MANQIMVNMVHQKDKKLSIMPWVCGGIPLVKEL
jgi:hypothetical protein